MSQQGGSPYRQQHQHQAHTPRSQAYNSPHSHHHQQPQSYVSPQQQQQQAYNSPHQPSYNSPQQQTPYGNNNHNNHGANLQQHHHGHTNTYPPRSSHTPGRHANDNGSNLDIADSYSDQLRKVSQGSGGGGVGDGGMSTSRPMKPVPLPRHNVPGAMAVVKPTVMHQGALTFMEI
ncbi:hypothetical protein BaRGS_00036378 [Batillaria attramentaria]|uniref:Uncharacterized protein n=1 Tax=Batillaria attramentaria TaxID=370345 RepID=A0ABD0JBS8_9CAEN